ncbi:MAG TPA: flagellin [Stellaceae bacterium]|nr:flagellin [Stellaceae bacterium]
MSQIVLGIATQQNLLALQQINQNLDTTQEHLSTGLDVASATDNAVAFFQAQALTERASDLQTRKDAIDQGISSLTTATQAAQSAVTVLEQLQGLLNSAKTETAAQRAAAGQQYNTLAKQLDELLNDASYQGLDLVNSSTSALNLQFSSSTASKLKITGSNLLYTATVTNLGGGTKGSKLKISLAANAIIFTGKSSAFSTAVGFSAVSNKTSLFDNGFQQLQNAINTVQAAAQALGGNVTFLQTRDTFTQQYIVTLNGGASQLTVADVNQESTNLVTLQTRQQLAIESLSIATQSEQSVLRLFH